MGNNETDLGANNIYLAFGSSKLCRIIHYNFKSIASLFPVYVENQN